MIIVQCIGRKFNGCRENLFTFLYNSFMQSMFTLMYINVFLKCKPIESNVCLFSYTTVLRKACSPSRRTVLFHRCLLSCIYANFKQRLCLPSYIYTSFIQSMFTFVRNSFTPSICLLSCTSILSKVCLLSYTTF